MIYLEGRLGLGRQSWHIGPKSLRLWDKSYFPFDQKSELTRENKIACWTLTRFCNSLSRNQVEQMLLVFHIPLALQPSTLPRHAVVPTHRHLSTCSTHGYGQIESARNLISTKNNNINYRGRRPIDQHRSSLSEWEQFYFTKDPHNWAPTCT